MADALHVRPNESALAYAIIHENWTEKVSDAAAGLAKLQPSLLLSNIPYLSLAAAKKAGVPAIAMSSLNWADVFDHYCGRLPGASAILQQMVEAYACARMFLQLTPAMAMPSIHNGQVVGPVALLGQDRRQELRRRLGWNADSLVVLLALGGTPMELDITRWPRLGRVKLVAVPQLELSHPDVSSSSLLDFSFIDLVRSCDAMIGKPSYGVVTEAACNGVPILVVPRPEWPEQDSLQEWLMRNGRGLLLTEEQLRTGNFSKAIEEVCAMPAPPVPTPRGIDEVAMILSHHLG